MLTSFFFSDEPPNHAAITVPSSRGRTVDAWQESVIFLSKIISFFSEIMILSFELFAIPMLAKVNMRQTATRTDKILLNILLPPKQISYIMPCFHIQSRGC